MRKEPAKIFEKKETISDVMRQYEASFSISLSDGFAHIKYIDQKMYVTWLNDDGYVQDEGQDVPFDDIERIANFMRDLQALRLTDYVKTL